jgi:hypothetical protein
MGVKGDSTGREALGLVVVAVLKVWSMLVHMLVR